MLTCFCRVFAERGFDGCCLGYRGQSGKGIYATIKGILSRPSQKKLPDYREAAAAAAAADSDPVDVRFLSRHICFLFLFLFLSDGYSIDVY